MTDEVRKWYRLAEGDWRAMNKLAGGDTHAAVWFHAQQCVEKLLKGCIVIRQGVPAYIHDLVALSSHLSMLDSSWSWDTKDLRFLTRGATESRYVEEDDLGYSKEAEEALRLCETLRAALLPRFGPLDGV